MKKLLEYKNLIMGVIVLLLFAACFSPSNETTAEKKATTNPEVEVQKNIE